MTINRKSVMDGQQKGIAERILMNQQKLSSKLPTRFGSMSFQVVYRFIGIAVVSLFPMWAPARQKAVADDRSEVVQTVQALFNALEASNDAQFTSLLTPDFYIFEGGNRLGAQEVLSLFNKLRAAGKSYNWNVTEPDVHVIGDTAWVAYVNKGSITDASGTKDQEWVESAFLEKQGTGWKIAFMHSTRVPKPIQNANDNKEQPPSGSQRSKSSEE
jgi:ketosteroid isomerase-like protein